MMKSVFSAMLLFSMTLAALVTPLSDTSASAYGADNTKITGDLVHRQVDPMAYGSPCSDEGAWFCMSTTFQRCASGHWTMAQDCSPGTQCEPLGLTYNSSQPAFGISDGSSNTVTTDAATTAPGTVSVTATPFTTITLSGSQIDSSLSAVLSSESTTSIPPVTRTTTTYVYADPSQSATPSSSTSSVESTSTSTSTSTSSSISITSSTSEPKADTTSDGTHTAGFSWWMMGMMAFCLSAGLWYR